MATSDLANRETRDAREKKVFDITFIGGGPVGLFGAFYAGLRGARTKIIESMSQLGGQPAALYPEKFIYDVPGFVEVRAKELVDRLQQQALQFKPTVCLGETVLELHREEELLRLVTNRGVHWSKAVVITAGIGAFSPKRLEKPGVAEFEGRGVYYAVSNLAEFSGKHVLVIGGGDSAVDWALMLEKLAEKVILIHRRDVFRAHEQNVRQLFDSTVEVRLFCELEALEGGTHPERALIRDTKADRVDAVPVDAVVVAIGFTPDLGPISHWGLTIEEGGIRVLDAAMETEIPGVYAAGDIATYPGKVKLIATGFGEVATAVNNAVHFINPKASRFPGHSSHLGLRGRRSGQGSATAT